MIGGVPVCALLPRLIHCLTMSTGLEPGADLRDENNFRAFTLRTPSDLAVENGLAADVESMTTIALPLVTTLCFFTYPSMLYGLAFVAIRSLGSSRDGSGAAINAFFMAVAGMGAQQSSGGLAPQTMFVARWGDCATPFALAMLLTLHPRTPLPFNRFARFWSQAFGKQ